MRSCGGCAGTIGEDGDEDGDKVDSVEFEFDLCSDGSGAAPGVVRCEVVSDAVGKVVGKVVPRVTGARI